MSSEGNKGSDSVLNIKEVVDRNVSYATLNDLQKKGTGVPPGYDR